VAIWETEEDVYLRDMDCEDGRWTELAQDRVQWWTLV
jgi:hypothetical protein